MNFLTLRPLENNAILPSYRISQLNDTSLVICRFIETYYGIDLEGRLILIKSGYIYELLFKLVRILQEQGYCYFVEKIEEVKYE